MSRFLARAVLLSCCAIPADDTVTLDFAKDLPAEWRTTKNWKVEQGELRGAGGGHLEWTRPLQHDFTLTFDAWTAEKANVEVHLLDAAGKKVRFAFAFLGQYHPVLDGVRCALLKDDRFVASTPRLWIFPGRMFTFEVRAAKNQYQMFLNGELGPVFADPAPDEKKDFRLRILVATEGKQDAVRLDNVKLTPRK